MVLAGLYLAHSSQHKMKSVLLPVSVKKINIIRTELAICYSNQDLALVLGDWFSNGPGSHWQYTWRNYHGRRVKLWDLFSGMGPSNVWQPICQCHHMCTYWYSFETTSTYAHPHPLSPSTAVFKVKLSSQVRGAGTWDQIVGWSLWRMVREVYYSLPNLNCEPP